MKKYQYQILRFCYDSFSEEFVNIGIVFYSPTNEYFKSEVTKRYKRISDFFNIPSYDYHRAINNINISIKHIASQPLFKHYENVEQITKEVLPPDDSSLRFSKVYNGISENLEKTFSQLFNKFINQYTIKPKITRNDIEVWREVFKPEFEKVGITKHLVKKEVKTKNDVFQFDHSWKNGVWHLYKPLTFDLADETAVKDKVYKWVGINEELKTSDEAFKLFYLAYEPKHIIGKEYIELTKFIREKLTYGKNGHEIKVIDENMIEKHVKQITKEMKKEVKH